MEDNTNIVSVKEVVENLKENFNFEFSKRIGTINFRLKKMIEPSITIPMKGCNSMIKNKLKKIYNNAGWEIKIDDNYKNDGEYWIFFIPNSFLKFAE